jgi:hypothetical protein
MDFIIDGKQSLAAQRFTLIETEQLENAELVRMSKMTEPSAEKKNRVSFLDLPLGVEIPELVLIEVLPGDNMASIIAAQLADGRNLIFTSTMFVEGRDARVAAFR